MSARARVGAGGWRLESTSPSKRRSPVDRVGERQRHYCFCPCYSYSPLATSACSFVMLGTWDRNEASRIQSPSPRHQSISCASYPGFYSLPGVRSPAHATFCLQHPLLLSTHSLHLCILSHIHFCSLFSRYTKSVQPVHVLCLCAVIAKSKAAMVPAEPIWRRQPSPDNRRG